MPPKAKRKRGIDDDDGDYTLSKAGDKGFGESEELGNFK